MCQPIYISVSAKMSSHKRLYLQLLSLYTTAPHLLNIT